MCLDVFVDGFGGVLGDVLGSVLCFVMCFILRVLPSYCVVKLHLDNT